MSGPATGALFGLAAALGLLVALTRLPVWRRPRLEDRLGPYLRDQPEPSRLLAVAAPITPFPTLERVARPYVEEIAGRIDRVVGGNASIRRRLVAAGRGMTIEEFRGQQVVWSALALLGVFALLVLTLAGGGAPSPVMFIGLSIAAVVGGVVGRDQRLSSEVHKREEAMQAEFPTVAELLALAVTAGEGPVGALERVSRLAKGELSRELSLALADARAGATLVQALDGIANRTSLSSLVRFVEGMVVAIERGTPLADVLRAQAVDVREAGKRALLEAGGRKEIAMMFPVVFLVLPVTVVFALYPGAVSLTVLAR